MKNKTKNHVIKQERLDWRENTYMYNHDIQINVALILTVDYFNIYII